MSTGLSRLAEAYLDELNLLHRLKDDATESERGKLIKLATDAETKVNSAFQELQDGGQLKELSARYKDLRSRNKKISPWPVYLFEEKDRMIRAMANEQKFRARRGVKP